VAGIVALAALSLSATATAAGVRHVHFTVPGSQTVPVPPGPARSAVLPWQHPQTRQQLEQAIAADTTVAGTNYSVTAGQNGDTYDIFIVGGNVTAGSSTTNFSFQVIPVAITFSATGDVYDPTARNAGCGEPVSPLTGMLTGPLLTRRNWYAGKTYLGHTEYTDSQMRGEFWAWTNPKGISPNWHVFLNGSNPVDGVATVNYPEVNAGTCSNLGEIDMGFWDGAVQSFLKSLGSTISPTAFPLILVKNVVFTTTSNGKTTCCIYGWHSVYTDSNGNAQTYGIAAYLTDGELGTIADTAGPSHEIAEWENDPFTNNPTPSWGHIGQQSGCQSNLEVGDPLSGTDFAVPPPLPGLPTYHLQELADFGWFYDDNVGVNGWYSTRGTFTSGATLCS
jgi:hypothetical protein